MIPRPSPSTISRKRREPDTSQREVGHPPGKQKRKRPHDEHSESDVDRAVDDADSCSASPSPSSAASSLTSSSSSSSPSPSPSKQSSFPSPDEVAFFTPTHIGITPSSLFDRFSPPHARKVQDQSPSTSPSLPDYDPFMFRPGHCFLVHASIPYITNSCPSTLTHEGVPYICQGALLFSSCNALQRSALLRFDSLKFALDCVPTALSVNEEDKPAIEWFWQDMCVGILELSPDFLHTVARPQIPIPTTRHPRPDFSGPVSFRMFPAFFNAAGEVLSPACVRARVEELRATSLTDLLKSGAGEEGKLDVESPPDAISTRIRGHLMRYDSDHASFVLRADGLAHMSLSDTEGVENAESVKPHNGKSKGEQLAIKHLGAKHAYLMPASHARFTGYHSDIVMHTVAAISASRELRFVQHTVSHFERECGVRFSDPLLIRRIFANRFTYDCQFDTTKEPLRFQVELFPDLARRPPIVDPPQLLSSILIGQNDNDDSQSESSQSEGKGRAEGDDDLEEGEIVEEKPAKRHKTKIESSSLANIRTRLRHIPPAKRFPDVGFHFSDGAGVPRAWRWANQQSESKTSSRNSDAKAQNIESVRNKLESDDFFSELANRQPDHMIQMRDREPLCMMASVLAVLGNAVMSFVCVSHLYGLFPLSSEGVLTAYRAALLKHPSLAIFANRIDLPGLYSASAAEGGRKGAKQTERVLATQVESVFACIYLDPALGIAGCRRVFADLLFNESDERLVKLFWLQPIPRPVSCSQEVPDRQYAEADETLQHNTGVRFRSPEIMAQAITHASYYMTARPGRPALHLPSTLLNARAPASMAGQGSGSLYSGLVPDNQRLEILGDAVIQLGVTRFLCMKCKLPQSLAIVRSNLVSNSFLASVAEDLGFVACVRAGKDVTHTATWDKIKKDMLADSFEAFVGAVYLDQNLETAFRFIQKFIFARFEDRADVQDPKTELQTLLQRTAGRIQAMRKKPTTLGLPVYSQVREGGRRVNKMFEAAVSCGGHELGRGTGHTLQEAYKAAARAAIRRVTEWRARDEEGLLRTLFPPHTYAVGTPRFDVSGSPASSSSPSQS